MKRSVILLFLLTGLVILNIYFYKKARDFTDIYPLANIITGDTITNKISSNTDHFDYGSKIIKIENQDVDSKNILKVLSGYSSKNELNITAVNKKNEIISKTVNTKTPNNSYLFLIICLMFFADIHYIWACIVYFVRSHETRAILYSIASILLSLLYYNTIDLFTFNDFNLFFPVLLLLIGFSSILLGKNLSAQKINKYIIWSILLFIFLYSLIQTISGTSVYQSFPVLFIYLLLCIIYLTAYFIITAIRHRKPAFSRRYFMMFLGICIGYLLPVLLITITLLTESGIQLYYFAGASLIFPIIIGNSFFKYSQYDYYGFKIIQRKDVKLFLYNVVATVLISFLLFSIVKISDAGLIGKWYIVISMILILALLNILHFINNTKKLIYENRDHYAISAQKIAEVGSSPIALENKVKYIFNEIKTSTGAESLKLILFMNSNYDYYSKLNEYIEVIPRNSDIFSFIKNENIEVIIKYTLLKTSGIEGKIYRFLEERNSTILITVIENEKIGVLVAGEKSGNGYYSFADMHYLRTMTNQIYQLIYSDWLHNDYLLKKQYENELDNASYVQMRLFPKVSLDRDRGMDISFFYRPYLRVIGDYFDFFKLDEDNTAIIIGDVSGHGLSTAMILSAVNGITNAMLREVKVIEKTCYEINSFLTNSYKGIELITLFIGIFNKKTKILEYINAGHGAPLLIRKDEKIIRQIEGRTKILGADPDAEYSTSNITLNSNDELILYTDGVMEIYNEETDTGINEEDFIKIIYDNIGKSIDNKIIEIEKQIKTHSEAIRDDITIIGVKIH